MAEAALKEAASEARNQLKAEYEVQVTEVSRQGDGIARVQGFVIFVKGGKVGDKCKVKIKSVGPRFATAEKV